MVFPLVMYPHQNLFPIFYQNPANYSAWRDGHLFIHKAVGTCVPGRDVPTHSKRLNFLPLLGECCLSYCWVMSPRLRDGSGSSHPHPKTHSQFWFLSMEFWILLLWLSIFSSKQCSLCGTARRLLTTWEWKLLSGHFSSTNHWTYLQTKCALCYWLG